MNTNALPAHEIAAGKAFSQQAPLFDKLYGADKIIQYKRARVRKHVLGFLQPDSSILELNAGTGEDAIFFAKQGHCVHATDISQSMQEMLATKIKNETLSGKISYERCSYSNLKELKQSGPYDFIFSNFAGLNCTNDLEQIIYSLPG